MVYVNFHVILIQYQFGKCYPNSVLIWKMDYIYPHQRKPSPKPIMAVYANVRHIAA